ncbi:hypothetical protein CS542_10280 [Pedobacter sp. IW39]|nr:hypothetical protein CS542_10280 [Pedobacter sp. IW39]
MMNYEFENTSICRGCLIGTATQICLTRKRSEGCLLTDFYRTPGPIVNFKDRTGLLSGRAIIQDLSG